MTERARVFHRRLPHRLVTADVVWRVHVADRKDAHDVQLTAEMQPRRRRALPPLAGRLHPPAADVSAEAFREEFGADWLVLPYTTCLLGFSAPRRRWLVHGFRDGGGHSRERLDALTRFFDRYVRRRLEPGSFWFFFNHWDAWREGAEYSSEFRWVPASTGIGSVEEWELGPGEIPILSSSRRWVACYGAQSEDPSALLLPEAHYLRGLYYRPLLARLRLGRVRWAAKRDRAIFAGRDHGPRTDGTTRRERLRSLVASQELPVDVHLGEAIPRRTQLAYKYLLDVDGWVRTWDAWAWKLASGSVVLSPGSHWTTFFTELFEPWEHFVPVAHDFSDLGERLAWCAGHDRECQEIARRARARLAAVYRPTWAGARLATSLQHKSAHELTVGDPT
jgi:hypothetical protein